MRRRQTSLPSAWFLVESPVGSEARKVLRRLPLGTGILVLGSGPSAELRRLAAARNATLAAEAKGDAVRVHNMRELRGALLRRTPLILLSPIYPTSTHPGWPPIPRMRAAALARLGGKRLFALGGMSAKKFKRVERLGFQGWAGISAFRT